MIIVLLIGAVAFLLLTLFCCVVFESFRRPWMAALMALALIWMVVCVAAGMLRKLALGQQLSPDVG